jgi:Hemopexin
MASFTLNNKLYVVADNVVNCYDMDTFKPVLGFNKTIQELWPGVWHLAIDTIVNINNSKLYFFRGAEVTRFDCLTQTVDKGYPQLVAANWRGLFGTGAQAAVNVENKWVYFFKKNEVLRFNLEKNVVDEYAAPIAKTWKEPAFANGVEDGVYLKNNKILFKTKEEKLVMDKDLNKLVLKWFSKWFLYDSATHQSLRVNLIDVPQLLNPAFRVDIKAIRKKGILLLENHLPCSPNDLDKDQNNKYEEIINWVKGSTGETISVDYLTTYKSTTCGNLVAWFLYKLGCKNKDWVNRKVPYNPADFKITDVINHLEKFEFTFSSGQTIAKIYQAMIEAWQWYDFKNGEKSLWTLAQQFAFTKKQLDEGKRPAVGDIIFLKVPNLVASEHIMIFIKTEIVDNQDEVQEERWHTADGGKESITFNMGFVVRKMTLNGSAKCVRVENESYPDRQIVGWLPLEKAIFVV